MVVEGLLSGLPIPDVVKTSMDMVPWAWYTQSWCGHLYV
jgi:hypothetical protein